METSINMAKNDGERKQEHSGKRRADSIGFVGRQYRWFKKATTLKKGVTPAR
jgi:hypothetical protein